MWSVIFFPSNFTLMYQKVLACAECDSKFGVYSWSVMEKRPGICGL